MTLEARSVALVQAIGADMKALVASRGSLAALDTTDKTNLVAALNEVKSLISTAGASINDAATSSSEVWSSQHTSDQIASVVNGAITALVNGAPAAYDTLKELSDALSGNDTALANLLAAVGNKVDYNQAQSLTTTNKLQACQNLGIGNPEVDLVAAYTAAKA